MIAVLYAPVILALCWACAANVTEPPPAPRVSTSTPWSATADALRNGPFRTLLLAYGVGALGAALPGTLVLFYVEHVLRAPQLAEAFLALYFVSGFVFLPVWTRLARRLGKKRAWLWAMCVNVGAFAFALPLGPGDTAAYALVCLVSGIGFGAGLVLPNSLASDAIDYDELRSGQRREGLYFGLWSVVTKTSAAIGAAAALPALKWAGYVSQGPQTDAALLALRVLYAGVPIACYAAGLALAMRFPIDDRVHRRIREAIAARASGAAVEDPLGITSVASPSQGHP